MADENFTVITDERSELNVVDEPQPVADEQPETKEVEDAPNTDDTATSEATPEAKEEEPKEGHSRYQKRIDKLVRQREEAEREKEALKQELEAIKSLPKKEAVVEKLDPLDFDSYEDYIEALNSQPKPKAEKKEVAQPSQEQKPVVDNSTMRKLDDAFEDAREKYKDFDEVVTDPKVPFTPLMVQALAEIESAGEVAYYLAKNKKEVERIAQLTPIKQAIELGKVADKLNQVVEKKISKAPEPINPVQAKGDTTRDVSKMDFAEYEAYMNNQSKKKGFW